MDQPSSGQANLPEKPAPAQVDPEHYHRHPGQPQQFQPVEMPRPERFRPSKPFSVGKLTLACFNFVFALIVLGLSIDMILVVAYYDLISLIIAATLAAASIIWQIAEFITLAARRSIHRPIHPGAHIGVHLVLTVLALLVALSCCVAVNYIVGAYSINADCNSSSASGYSSSSYDCDYYSYFSSDAAARSYIMMLEALTAFVIFMTVAHFTLFVLACVEADRRRKWGSKTKVVYLVAAPPPPPPPADGRMYYSHAPPERWGTAGVVGSADPGPQGYYAPPAPAAAAASPARRA